MSIIKKSILFICLFGNTKEVYSSNNFNKSIKIMDKISMISSVIKKHPKKICLGALAILAGVHYKCKEIQEIKEYRKKLEFYEDKHNPKLKQKINYLKKDYISPALTPGNNSPEKENYYKLLYSFSKDFKNTSACHNILHYCDIFYRICRLFTKISFFLKEPLPLSLQEKKEIDDFIRAPS